jgi:iron complex transport system ATP-binding protein
MTIQADHISVYVGHKALVKDLSVTIHTGEVLAILGPNGAGKSTLLKAICGDIKSATGKVTMGDKDLAEWGLNERAKIRGILTQNVPLNFTFSVLEVVLMGRSPHLKGRETTHDYQIAYQAMALAQVDHLHTRIYTTLSGGEKQRVQFARVLAQIWEDQEALPRYLLMDEPTSSLDLTHQHTTLRVARQFASQGVGVLTILHDLNLAAEYADKVMLMKNGECLAYGDPFHVLTTENIAQAYQMQSIITEHPISKRPLIVPITSEEVTI